MKVNSTQIFKNNVFKHAVTQLGKSGALLPVVLLEVAVDTGRSYQAYKRGGFTEMRERATDDISAGIFWLFGAVMFNKLGDKIGKKFLGIKNPEFSLGKDKARNGLEQAVAANPGISSKKLSLFKLGKVVSSIALAIGFIGWVLPKINQTITRKLSDKKENSKVNQPSTNQTVIENASKIFEDFEKYKNQKDKQKPSFGAFMNTETIGKIAHNLEHDATWRLGSTDGGILVGRTTNARTFDEGLEYGVRDACSSYFYLWAHAHVVTLLNMFDKYKGSNTRLDPVSATHVNNYLASILKDRKMTVEEFKKEMLETFDKTKFKLVESKLKKNKGFISVEDFCKLVGANNKLKAKANVMSKLQPKLNGVSILTDIQVKDVLSSGKIYNPSFLYKVLNRYFADSSIMGKRQGTGLKGTLTDGLKFVDIKDVETQREYIEKYVKSIIDIANSEAKNKGGIAQVSIDTVKAASKRNLSRHSLYLAAGLGVSMLFLSTLIPKFQYWITKMRTGKDGFPGVQEEKKAA